MAYYGVLADLATTNTFTELNTFSAGVKCLVEPVDLNDLVTLNYFNNNAPTPPAYPFTVINDTNIVLSLSGSPTTCLLASTNLSVSWNGVLSTIKGGTGQSSYTDGQLLIGSTTSGSLVKSTLTAGPGITITNSPGSITIDTVSSGPVVSTLTGTANQILVNGSSSIPTSGDITLTLPQDISEESGVKFTTIGLKSSNFSNFIQSSTLSNNRNFYLPDADSSSIQPRVARTLNQFITHIDSSGTQFSDQPAMSELSGILAPSQGGTGVNNSGLITLGGNITTLGNMSVGGLFTTSAGFSTSGSFAMTLIATGATSVILPTSGTLATIASTIPSITGTTNQVSVNGSFTTSATGSAITLALPQNISATSTPTFSSINVDTASIKSTSFTNQITTTALTENRIVTFPNAASNTLQPRSSATANEFLTHIDSTGTQFSAQPSISSLSGVLSPAQGGTGVNNGSATINLNGATITIDGILSTAGSLITSGNFTTIGVSPLTLRTTVNTDVTLPASGTLATISSTVPSIKGTSNQIAVNGSFTAAATGTAITLSLPQSISTTSTPQFSSMTSNTLTVTGSGIDATLVNFNGNAIARVLQISTNINVLNADSNFIGTYGTLTNGLSNTTFSQIKIAGSQVTTGLTNTGVGLFNAPTFSISGSGTYTAVYGAQFTCAAPVVGAHPNVCVKIDTPTGGINNYSLLVQGNSGFGANTTPIYPVSVGGNCAVTSVGSGFRIAEGVNAKSGVATLVSGAVTVSNTSVTANSRIILTPNILGGVARPEGVGVTSRTPGSNFVITSKGGGDTSVVYYQIIEPS